MKNDSQFKNGNQTKLLLKVLLTLILIIQTQSQDLPEESLEYECTAVDTNNNNKTYVGRVLLSTKFMPSVRINLYEKESALSSGMSVSFQFRNTSAISSTEVPYQPISLVSFTNSHLNPVSYTNSYPAISSEFSSRGKMLWINEGSKFPDSAYRKYNAGIMFSFNNNPAPFVLSNMVNDLKIWGKVRLEESSELTKTVYLEFKSCKVLEGWGWTIALSIMGLALPCFSGIVVCMIGCISTDTRTTDKESNTMSYLMTGVTTNTLMFVICSCILTFVSFFSLLNIHPWPLIYQLLDLIPFFIGIGILKSGTKTKKGRGESPLKTIDLYPKGFTFIFWIGYLVCGVCLLFFLTNYLIWFVMIVGNLIYILDLIRALKKNLFYKLRIVFNAMLILVYQVSLISVFGVPNNIWYIPNGMNFTKYMVYSIALISPPFFLILYFLAVHEDKSKPLATDTKAVTNSIASKTKINAPSRKKEIELNAREQEIRRKQKELREKKEEIRKLEVLTKREMEIQKRELDLKRQLDELKEKEEAMERMKKENGGAMNYPDESNGLQIGSALPIRPYQPSGLQGDIGIQTIAKPR